uniref:Proliferating cell nuclear antigen PCNA N-terminal domain-containing protein n=1 Tax=viral metagenome TaxID=1070528 RepID=A0A6C0LZL8_9ZZZZ
MADDKASNNKTGLLMEMGTCQTASFRVLIEALKEVLKDVNIKFTGIEPGNPNSGGMTIAAMNASQSVLIKLRLPARCFDSYFLNPKCGKNHVIGVNMNSFFKLIKTMSNDDNLTLYIEESDTNNLGIRLENGEKKYVTTYKLKLLELSNHDTNLPNSQFQYMISIPSDRFHKIIRDASSIAEFMDIKFVDTKDNANTLIFSCRGEFASQETILTDNTDGLSVTKNIDVKNDCIVQGLYDLKNLTLFTKCGNLCSNIELYLKNNYPLVIKYQVANLGWVYLVLSPINNNHIIDSDSNSDSDSD